MWCPKCNNGMAVEITDKEVIMKCFICGNRVLFMQSINDISNEYKNKIWKCEICNIPVKSTTKVRYCKKHKKMVRKKKMKENYIAYRKRNNLPIYNQ